MDCIGKSRSFKDKYETEMKNKNFHGYHIAKYGSMINGLGSQESSDLDLTILVDDLSMNHEEILKDVKAIIMKHGGEIQVQNAKDPSKKKKVPRYMILIGTPR